MKQQRTTRTRRALFVIVVLAVVSVAVAVFALGLGPVSIAPADVVAILWQTITAPEVTVANALVVTELRLPRIVLAYLAGAGLAVAGAAMQAYFRNPLADPGVTGVANGAALGAVIVLVTGISTLGTWTLSAAAFLGAAIVLVIIQAVAMVTGSRGVTTVLLVGIAINAFTGALTSAVIANAEDSETVRGAMFWLQGDLTAASWSDVGIAIGPVLVGTALLMVMFRELNGLLLGPDTAQSVGMNVTAIRVVVLFAASIIIGGTVAVTGVIGFVGLVAPHVVRLLIGSDHRYLVPAAALLGGAFLVLADTVARLAPASTSWQTGVVTGLVGAPFFLVLVLRSQSVRRATI